MPPAEKRRWTLEEYLAMERESDVRHEFFDGEILAMAAASAEHELIVANVGGELSRVLRRPMNESAR